MRQSNYKQQVEFALLKYDWKITTIGKNTNWWDDEHWEMRCKYKPNINFYICFIVDPAYEGERKKGQGIYEIKALTEFPESWNDDNDLIACLCMRKDMFDEKVLVFVDEIVKKLDTLKDS